MEGNSAGHDSRNIACKNVSPTSHSVTCSLTLLLTRRFVPTLCGLLMLRYLSFACLAFLGLPSFLLAHEEALYRSEEYNAGQHGEYVEQHFVSTNVTAPRLNLMRPYGTCDDGSYLFIAPRGEKTQSSVCILDASGSLVWTSNDYHGQAYNLQVQEYHGESYLTFWAGDNSVGGHGVGQYFMVRHAASWAIKATSLTGRGHAAGPALQSLSHRDRGERLPD